VPVPVIGSAALPVRVTAVFSVSVADCHPADFITEEPVKGLPRLNIVFAPTVKNINQA